MATSVLDVRSAFVPPRLVGGPTAVRTAAPAAPRRVPLTVLAAAALAVSEALGLLAVGLTGLDGLLVSATRPHGGVVAAVVLLLAGWIVFGAGSGATMVDGAGRRGFVALAHVELVVVAVTAVTAAAVGLPGSAPAYLSEPVLVLAALAVPVAKLLLAGSPSARAWIAAGPRVRERRPDPVARHRLACTLTVAAIGLGLGAVAVAGPQPEGPAGVGAAAATVVGADR